MTASDVEATLFDMVLFDVVKGFNHDAHVGEDLSGDFQAFKAVTWGVLHDAVTGEPHYEWDAAQDGALRDLYAEIDADATITDWDKDRRRMYAEYAVRLALCRKRGYLDKAPLHEAKTGLDAL